MPLLGLEDLSKSSVLCFHSSFALLYIITMQRVTDHPMLKLKRSAQTRWLSLQNAVDALRCCFTPLKAVLDHTAIEGDALAKH